MTDQHIPTAEHVGIIAGISSVLLGWLGFHRMTQAKVHARLDHLAETKADKHVMESLGERLENRLEAMAAENTAAHQKIYDYLIGIRGDHRE